MIRIVRISYRMRSDIMEKASGWLLFIGCLCCTVTGWALEKVAEQKHRSSLVSEEPLSSPDLNLEKTEESNSNTGDCKPKWKNEEEEVESALTIVENSTIKLKCPATGKPKPSIKWFKKGHEILSNWDGKIVLKSYTLELKQASSPFDEGEYKCIVENGCGKLQKTFSISVIVRYMKRPVFRDSPKNQTVIEGSNVTLICRTLSDMPVYFEWLKVQDRPKKASDEEQFEYLKTGGNKFVNQTHLTIIDANVSDSGQYMCYAANQFGDSRRSAWISVLAAPRKSESVVGIDTFSIILIVVLLGFCMASVLLLFLWCLFLSRRRLKRIDGLHVSSLVKQWEIARENLKLFEAVGEGEFGIVYRGQIAGTPNVCGYLNQTIVAVKMLKVGATIKEVEDLVAEMNTMKCLGYHPNVIQLIGLCTLNGPFAVVMEYAAYGSLKNLLCKFKSSTSNVFVMPETEEQFLLVDSFGVTPYIDNHQLLKFSTQVAKGLEYMASKKIVHRDVAARNVLVADDFVAKIADFGLTRDVASSLSEQYIPGRHRCLPIKWMSPESLETKVFTMKSDVWSFGVLLWEIFTYASNPYPTIPVQKLTSLLKTGYRLEKPPDASDEMYQIMKGCWQWCPDDRPSFSALVDLLQSSEKTKDFIKTDNYNMLSIKVQY